MNESVPNATMNKNVYTHKANAQPSTSILFVSVSILWPVFDRRDSFVRNENNNRFIFHFVSIHTYTLTWRKCYEQARSYVRACVCVCVVCIARN